MLEFKQVSQPIDILRLFSEITGFELMTSIYNHANFDDFVKKNEIIKNIQLNIELSRDFYLDFKVNVPASNI